MRVVEVHLDYNNGRILATVDMEQDKNQDILLQVTRKTRAMDIHSKNMVQLSEGEKLTLLQSDPEPGDVFLIVRRHKVKQNLQVISNCVKFLKPKTKRENVLQNV